MIFESWVYLVCYPLIGLLFRLTNDFGAQKNLRHGIASGLLCGALTGFLMSEHDPSTLIFGGMIIGALVSGKINYIGHYLALAAVLIIILYSGNPLVPLIPVLLISVSLLLGELLSIYGFRGATGDILRYHPILNLSIILLFISGSISLGVLIAFFVAEIVYKIGGRVVEKAQ